MQAEVAVPVHYKGLPIDRSLRLDLLIDSKVIVEVKAVSQIEEIHRAQILTYLRLTDLDVGLVINFNVPVLRQGIKRVINSLRPSVSSAPPR